jgi:hypothetical protein
MVFYDNAINNLFPFRTGSSERGAEDPGEGKTWKIDRRAEETRSESSYF